MDLQEQKTFPERVPEKVYAHLLGGKGLGAYLLYRHNCPGVDPRITISS